MQEIVQALKENKFIALTFTLNGDRIQVCGTARAEKGIIAEPMNLLVSAEELDGALNAMFGCWTKGKKKEEKKAEQKTETEKTEKTDLNGAATHSRAEEPKSGNADAAAEEEPKAEQKTETEKTDLNGGGNADAAAEEEPKAEPETKTEETDLNGGGTQAAAEEVKTEEEDEWE